MSNTSSSGETRIIRAAKVKLDQLANNATLEAVWIRAGAEAVLSGELLDPPIHLLKTLTTFESAWDCARWPAEAIGDRGQNLTDCYLLAIAINDHAWLEQLGESWESAPVDIEWKMYSQGQIGLGLRPGGERPYGWTDDDIEWLIEEHYLSHDAPNDRVWLSLAAGDVPAARHALTEYRAEVEESASRRYTASDDEVRRILAFPGEVLRLQLRALETLVTALS